MPVPLDLLKPAVEQLRGSDGRLSSLAERSLQQAAEAAQQLAALPGALAPPAVKAQQERLLAAARQWDPALLQLGSVFDEVGSGFKLRPFVAWLAARQWDGTAVGPCTSCLCKTS